MVTNQWPFPRVQDILDRLSNSEWFTTLDLASGYWQVKMSQESKKYTAFSTADGHYQFKLMPFGLKYAPKKFNRIMHVMRQMPNVEVYFDDIIVDEHILDVSSVLSKNREVNLKLKASKCDWFRYQAKILGHEVSKDKIAMDDSKIKAIKERIAPKTVNQLQQFLGICNYYRRFVKNYAKIAVPLRVRGR